MPHVCLPMADRQLRSVQILRGIAATGVVLTHLVAVERKYLPGIPLTPHGLEIGGGGVDLFFVISGFIMTSITIGRPRRPGDSRRFLLRRFTRIYPLYWLYFALLLPVVLLDPHMVNSSHGRPDLLTSFFLLPSPHLPLLMVAWTLSFELYFYLVYACLFRWLDRGQDAVALLGWGAAVAAGNVLLHPTMQQPVLHLLFDPLNLEFIAGCFVGRLAGGIGRITASLCLVAALVVICAGGMYFGPAPVLDPQLAWTRVLIYGTGATLLLIGALGWESATRFAPRALVGLGDASYSLYLSHLLVLGAVGWLWHRLLAGPGTPDHVALLMVCFTAALAWSWISYTVAERPLLSASRQMMRVVEARVLPHPAKAVSGRT